MFSISVFRYEMDDLLTITDDRVLVSQYRTHIKMYRTRLPAMFEWMASLFEYELKALRLVHQPRNDTYYERIMVDTKILSREGDNSVLAFKNHLTTPPTYRIIGN